MLCCQDPIPSQGEGSKTWYQLVTPLDFAALNVRKLRSG